MKGSKLLTSNSIRIVFSAAGLRTYLTILRKKRKKSPQSCYNKTIQKTIRKLITQGKEPYMIDSSVFWRNRKLVTAHSPKCKVHQFAFDFIPSTLILTDDCPSVMLNRWIVIPVPKYSTELTLMYTTLPECLHLTCSALVQTTSFWASTQIQKTYRDHKGFTRLLYGHKEEE